MKIGLTNNEVELNRKKYGSNILKTPKKRKIFNIILDSLGDPIIKILLIALAIKIVFMFKDFNWYETLGILIAIFLATLISTLSEYGSENAFQKLQDQNKDIDVKAYRNNDLTIIKTSEIVKDDIILLESGDIVPADGIIIDGNLEIDESMLTGESNIIQKNKNNKVFKGTIIFNGKANVKIVSVGENTVYGEIAQEILSKKGESPLKKRLVKLSKIINRVGYIGALLVSLSYLFSTVIIKNGFNYNLILNYIETKTFINDLIYTLTLCVTTIVVAVPEGLPMMITLVLSSNMKKLVSDKVLVKKMIGIETAGNIDYLLTDKTGTITKGKLEMVSYITSDLIKHKTIDSIDEKLRNTILESLLYNNQSEYSNGKIVGGNETDKSIIKYLNLNKNIKKKKYDYIPFSSEKKYSKATINDKTYIKGAYDVLLDKCDYRLCNNLLVKPIDRKTINKYIELLTKKGYRVLVNIVYENNKYYFLGLIVIKDEIRENSIEGIKNIKSAGINVIMITGDHKDTASSIAKEVGIVTNNSDLILTSKELNELKHDYLLKNIERVKVIARAYPKDKTYLVKILQEKKHIVGMTGDGVNDAPALKTANVGFAMGSGTSVSKEAADIVILDNNLLSISKAILFGRTIFKSIRKFIVYQLSVNLCALTLSIIGPLIGVSAPITIVQMLWLNMIMDTFAGLAFSFEPTLEKYLKEKPINREEPIINKNMYLEILTNGIYTALICILFLKLPIVKLIFGNDRKYFMTAYFALFIFMGIFNAFSCRTKSINIFKDISKNIKFLMIFLLISIFQILIIYYGGNIFGTYGIKLKHLLLIILISMTTLIVNSFRKLLLKKE